jgi:hypothetical protein
MPSGTTAASRQVAATTALATMVQLQVVMPARVASVTTIAASKFPQPSASSDFVSNNRSTSCGEEGHFSRDCPQPRKAMGACFNCGEEG